MTMSAPELTPARDTTEVRLLEDFQRGLPLEPRPFAAIASKLGLAEASVIARLDAMQRAGLIARVGGVVRPNTLGASTLAAMTVPDLMFDDIADTLAGIAGINHIYMRENALNLWFVVTGPDRDHVATALTTIEKRTGLRVLDLRLERAYHIDLGFPLVDSSQANRRTYRVDLFDTTFEFAECDRELVQILTDGLQIVPRPFAIVGETLGIGEIEVIDRLKALTSAGIVPRIGVIVRHRALGWRSNAMVVWDVPPEDVDAFGVALSQVAGVNLCYRRTRYPRDWPYNLYCMVHARTRDEACDTIVAASRAVGLDSAPRRILFSLRCYKQTGALVAHKETRQ